MEKNYNLLDEGTEYLKFNTENTELNKLNFKVHASLIYKLGESLISDEITALSELIKNSYDADASFCQVRIEPDYEDDGKKGQITIYDNGCGMSMETLVNGWLIISNSPKKGTNGKKKTTPKYHRIPLGEKGLGRFSAQKLGRKVTLVTKQATNNKEYTVTIMWNQFQENTTIDQIAIPCTEKTVENDKSYTRISISDLNDNAYWKAEKTIKELETTIGRIISPFRFDDKSFVVSVKVGEYSVDVSNDLFNDVLKTARSKFVFEVEKEQVTLTSRFSTDFFKKRQTIKAYPDFDFRRDWFKEMHNKNQALIDGWEYIEKDDKEDYVYEIKKILYLGNNPILKCDTNTNDIAFPGQFTGTIYDFYLDKNYVSSLLNRHGLIDIMNSNAYSDYIQKNKGIKVIRDGFVVQGYGDGNVDWLKLSAGATTTGRYADLNNETIIGYICISGEHNSVLKETTSREGFVADNYYRNFYSIIRDIIVKEINNQIHKMTKIFSAYLKETQLPETDRSSLDALKNISDKAQTVSKEIEIELIEKRGKFERELENLQKSGGQLSFNGLTNEAQQDKYEDTIKQFIEMTDYVQNRIEGYLSEIEQSQRNMIAIEEEINAYKEKLSDVFSLAGLGLSVEMFTHELYTTINKVTIRAKNIQPQNDDLRYIQSAMNTLRKQLSYFHPGLKYVRMSKEEISVIQLLDEHMEFYKSKCEIEKIKQSLKGRDNSFIINTNRGIINQVLDNLFSNAVYWLKYSRDKLHIIDQCTYTIEINEDATIDVWDNGIGVSKDVENDLFEPFVTRKENGRGLGLFVCRNNLENNNASIRLLRQRNQFGNLFKFHLDLSNLKQGRS